MRGGEKLWEVAEKVYNNFAEDKNCIRHLSDMVDIIVLVCRAIENPGSTPSSALRTSLMSVL